MGFGGISLWQLLIILLIVVLVFGTKKLRNIGGDLGGAVRNFKRSMSDGEKDAASSKDDDDKQGERLEKREDRDADFSDRK